MASKQKAQKAAPVDLTDEEVFGEPWTYERALDGKGWEVYTENRKLVAVTMSEVYAQRIVGDHDCLEELADVVFAFPEFELEEEISGSDAVEYLGDSHWGRKQMVENAVGKKLVIGEDKNYVFRNN